MRGIIDTPRGWLALYLPPIAALVLGAVLLVSCDNPRAPVPTAERAPDVVTEMALDLGAAPSLRIPSLGWELEAVLVAELEARWGLEASRYVALSAAQIHQESHWRPSAESPFAQGLTQFTPDTSAWIAERFRAELWPADPWDPYWSIRAMTLYDHWLHGRIDHAHTECDHWAMTLSGYNGGLGWVQRDRALCRLTDRTDGDCHMGKWFGHVELHTPRAAWAMRENRDYVRRILRTLTPGYLAAGFDGEDLCQEV